MPGAVAPMPIPMPPVIGFQPGCGFDVPQPAMINNVNVLFLIDGCAFVTYPLCCTQFALAS
jgi:hypothetical protein